MPRWLPLNRMNGNSPIPIPVRLIRVTTENGEAPFLMTSLLDADAFPHACFGDLYHQRWGIEENFKHMPTKSISPTLFPV